MAHIRRYQSSDFEAVLHVFRDTASPDLRNAGDDALHPASYIWCRPYLRLSELSNPSTHCFVIDDGRGKAVGYVIGTADTQEFVKNYRNTYLPEVESKQELNHPESGRDGDETPGNLPSTLRRIAYSPEDMLHDEEPDLIKDYPAHLHVDILPDYQRQGYGKSLIQRFCDTIHQKHGTTGVHLIMAAHNVEAGKFYDRIGFQKYPRVIDGGKSGEMGKEPNGSMWRVKKL